MASDDSDDDVTDLTARPGDSAHASPRPGAAVKKVKADPAGDSGGSKATQVPGSSTTLGGIATSLKSILSAVHSYSCHAAPATAAQASQAAQAVQVAQAAAAQAAQAAAAAAAAAAKASRQHAAAPASARTGGGAQGTSTAADRQKEKIDEALDTGTLGLSHFLQSQWTHSILTFYMSRRGPRGHKQRRADLCALQTDVFYAQLLCESSGRDL